MNGCNITISVVNHGHCDMLHKLLDQLADNTYGVHHVIITHNIESQLVIDDKCRPFRVTVIENISPLGFGANHNQAFRYCSTQYYCVMNPDIEIYSDPFLTLLNDLEFPNNGIVAPKVYNEAGNAEDSYRTFPTPFSILKKILFKDQGLYKIPQGNKSFYPDWVAGMFMLMPSRVYDELAGFDEGYFLYYEDVDLCARAARRGYKTVVNPNVRITHHARRDSHRKLKYLIYHIKSMTRFFLKS